VRERALSVLATRSAWTRELLAAVDAGRVPKEAVSEWLVERMRLHAEPEIEAKLARLFPTTGDESHEARRTEIARWRDVLGAAGGNPYAGEKLYEASCGRCHRLFGKGGEVGPDLTAYPRHDTETLLFQVVDPNAEIREGYRTSLVATLDGRILSGIVVEQDGQALVLRDADGAVTTIARDDIVAVRGSETSLMPEGLLSEMRERDVLDLFAFLRTGQPISR
jgi:putative heme-binding domain-containing protein